MKKIIFYLGIFSFLFIFISCENFLNGSDLVQKLDETIAYNNAEECSLYIKSQDGTGHFLNEGEIKLKVGYSVDLQFTVNSKYIFNNLIAVSSNDNSKNRNDYIHFTPINSDEAKGVYTVQAKLLKPANDILITADCFLIPEIISSEPNSLNVSVPQDTSIVVKFNKPVEPEYFITEDGHINCDTIKIYANETNLLDSSNALYFDKPYLSDSNTILTIPTVKSLFIIPVGSSETKDISVKINWNGTVSGTNSKSYTVDYSFSYKINNSKDTKPPVITKLYATPTLDTSQSYYHRLSELEYDDWETSDPTGTYRYGTISQNHVSKLYFTFMGYDKESGIKCIKTQEIFEIDADGNELNNADEELFSYPSDSMSFIQTEDGQQAVTFKYNFTHQDNGLIKIKVFIYDYAENYVEKDFEVIFQNNFSPKIDAKGDATRIVHAYNENGSKKETIPAPLFTFLRQLTSNRFFKDYTEYNEYTLYITDKKTSKKLYSYTDKFFPGHSNTDIINAINNEIALQTINPFIDNYYIFEIKEIETGNITQYEYIIPKVVDLSFYTTVLVPTTDVSNNNLDVCVYYTFESIEDESKSIKNLVTLTSKSSTNGFTKKIGSTYALPFFKKENFGKGIFTFYAAEYKEDIFVGALGASIKVYNDMENPNAVTPLSSSDFPKLKVENMKIYEKNSSKMHYRVTFIEPDDDYTYLIKYVYRENANYQSESDKTCYTTEREITVSNFGTCKFSLVAIDRNGNFAGESKTTTMNLYTYDLTAPYLYTVVPNQTDKTTYFTPITSRYYVYTDNSMYGLKPYDLNLKNGEKNYLNFISYYFIPISTANSLPLTEEALSMYKEYKYNFSEHVYDTEEHCYYDLDTSEITNGRYVFFAKAVDSSGNFKISKNNYSNSYLYYYLYPEGTDIELNEDKTSINISCPYNFTDYFYDSEGWCEDLNGTERNGLKCIIEAQYFDSNDKQWKTLKNGQISNNSNFDIAYSENETLIKNNYIRALARIEAPYGSTSGVHYSYKKNVFLETSYYFPSYEIDKLSLENKNIQEGLLGYQINCDQPTLVHTMYNGRKLSETTSLDDIHLWETKGKEIGTVVKSSTFTYSSDDYNVPENAWYTTIVHFADGKIWMSEPKQK